MAKRKSLGSIALIRGPDADHKTWLARWNRKWKAYNFVAGHKREAESFRECAIREVAEELGLCPETDFSVSAKPLARLEYAAWSESAKADTDYTHEVFDVELATDDSRRRAEATPETRWLTSDEIQSRQCADGRPVSTTMATVLARLGEGGVTMSGIVTWMDSAKSKVLGGLVDRFSRELEEAFPGAEAITIYDCLCGYSSDQPNKIVLGVEVQAPESCRTHVVKLGTRRAVAQDFTGWQKCVLRHNFASRIFLPVKQCPLRDANRLAIVYQDAYTLFDISKESQSPQSLEQVVEWAVADDKPDPTSVERVIRQIYCDLARWFYQVPRMEPGEAVAFYERRLKRARPSWDTEPWRTALRRDCIWLFCGQDPPGGGEDPVYEDPYDVVAWALAKQRIPQTLVGRSHGDLHGRNVLVGVQRGEAEYPAVFDYGAMDDRNVLVWDFVKLENELKVRLLLSLYQDEAARKTLLANSPYMRHPHGEPLSGQPYDKVDPRTLRADQLVFAFEFELRLAEQTERVNELARPDSSCPPGGRNITGNGKLDRALALIMRIRQEAAYWLGDRQAARGHRGLWKDEYYFGLAVYGVATGKFDYKKYETAFALVSAGVAAAQVDMVREEIRKKMAGKGLLERHCVSYRVPLARAHRLWRTGDKKDASRAVKLLEKAHRSFDHAVPILQEYALVLVATGEHAKALALLNPLLELCRIFQDYETLCRVGGACKDMGDRALARDLVPMGQLPKHPAWQWYYAAYERYHEAFEMREDYYPGINTATLALIIGRDNDARALAEKVLAICAHTLLGAGSSEDRFWLLATEGEASLLCGERTQAVSFYKEALDMLEPGRAGMAQSAYNQVCRLCWALGKSVVGPVVDVFRNAEDRGLKLTGGPLGNCMSKTGLY